MAESTAEQPAADEPEQVDPHAAIAELREEIASLKDERDAYRDAVLKPRLDDLDGRSDDARADRAELRATVEDLQETVAHLNAKLESLLGVDAPSASTPVKRERDLAQALIRQADARSDDYAGKASKHYREVQNLYAELGHGDVNRSECYDAMRSVAELPGFDKGTKVSDAGNQVECVRVELETLHREIECCDSTTPNPLESGSDPRLEVIDDKLG